MNSDLDALRLQALLDGELGPAESAALLAEVQASPALRERLGTLTADRALLRQAYAQPPAPPPRRVAAPDRRRAMALAALALLGVGGVAGLWWRGEAAPAAPASVAAPHIVLHVAANDGGQALAALAQAEGLLSTARSEGRALTVEVVANAGGLDLLRTAAAPDAARVQRLQQAYPALRFVACGQTVQKLRERGEDVRLLPGTTVAASALDQIVLRLQQGWTYLRV